MDGVSSQTPISRVSTEPLEWRELDSNSPLSHDDSDDICEVRIVARTVDVDDFCWIHGDLQVIQGQHVNL